MSYAVFVQEYDARWDVLFQQEKAAITGALGSLVVAIEHFGSTSVPQLAAKPIVDVLVGVRHLSPGGHYEHHLLPLGYEFRPDAGAPDRHFFRKGTPRSHHLHLVAFGSDEWSRSLLFRDYLRAHPVEAERYAHVKRQLAAAFQHDRQRYADGKAPLMVTLLAAAELWATQRPK